MGFKRMEVACQIKVSEIYIVTRLRSEEHGYKMYEM